MNRRFSLLAVGSILLAGCPQSDQDTPTPGGDGMDASSSRDAASEPVDQGTLPSDQGAEADASDPPDTADTGYARDANPQDDLGAPDLGAPTPLYVLVASGTWGGQQGTLVRYAFDPETGALSDPLSSSAGRHASYLTWDATNRRVHVGDETDGNLRSFSVAGDGTLASLGQARPDGNPVYVAHAQGGQVVLSTSYGGGKTESWSVGEDGALGERISLVETGPKSHSVVVGPSGSDVYVPVLELDQIKQFTLTPGGELVAKTPALVATAPGSGPRHITAHPRGDAMYVIHEADCTLQRFAIGADGALTPGSAVPIYPNGIPDDASGADVHVHPSGRWLLATTRPRNGKPGHLVVAALDDAGAIGQIELFETQGTIPRNFAVSPDGGHVLVGNRESGDLAMFAFDAQTGTARFLDSYDRFSPFFVGFVEGE